ncbi:alpha-2-macroglobulin family protein [Flavobacterium ajazii]|uniref:alpha-2-macroglobulin family protein n=1 Tax=Flavobacterium ajazii TaxID=2692318 RepID=UPI0013D1DBCF|nr:alpha-2-macroglobulin family protein [Flavobacterium ajazii]
MKNILFVFLLFSISLFAQQNDKKWTKAINYENEGKIKSANEVVAKIYKKAVAKKDEPQMIKCFFYHSKYLQVLDENAKTKIVENLKKDINRVSIPSKAILNLIYAKHLKDKYNYDDVYAIVDSAVAYVDSAAAVVDSAAALIDAAAATIDTASVTGIKIEEIDSVAVPESDYVTAELISENDVVLAFEKTLENEEILKKTPLTSYKDIFDFPLLEKFKEENVYTYLVKENIDFYKEKIETWKIDHTALNNHKEELLGDSDTFLKFNLDFAKDENTRKVVSLYQKLEADNPSLENQFDRAQFCSQILLDSAESFSSYLDQLAKKATKNDLTQKIKLEKAKVLLQLASKETYPNNKVEALALLDEIIKKDDKSNTSKLASVQKQNILSKFLSVELIKNSYENENTRAHIQYTNVNKLSISFYKIDLSQAFKFEEVSEIRKDSLVKLILQKQKKISSETYNLIDKKNYFPYSTEVLLTKLPKGNYLVYFESDSDSKDKKAFGYETITVSNISALVSRKDQTETYQVLDRKTGKPLENVSIQLKDEVKKTNIDGITSFKVSTNQYAYDPRRIKFILENDSIVIPKNYIQYAEEYKTSENKRTDAKVEFYLDRAIYRPGQNVYFKGIVIQKNKTKTSVVANINYKVFVTNGNYQKIKEFDVKTNEYGSFFGEFIIPKNGMTGSYHIGVSRPDDIEKTDETFWNNTNLENSTKYFDVEEYKRPKFEVTFDTKKESFQLNAPVKIKGNAKAFAGSSISDAVVKYTVSRYTTYFRNYYGREENETLVVGETKTDASGKFTIDFTALPSENSLKENLPVFNYDIEASVTDINGETHTAQTSVKIGYHDLMLNVQIPNRIDTKDKNEIKLSSTNLNGEFLAAKGEVKLYFVSPFSNKFKPAIFNKAELEMISKEDFEKLFPYEMSENSINKEHSETLLFSKKIDTEKDKKIVLDFISNYKSGNYKIVFSAKDTFNNPVEATSNFSIKQSKDKYDPSKLFTVEQVNTDPKKDGYTLIKVASVIQELYLITNANYENKIYFENVVHLKNHETTIKIPLKNEFEKQIKIGFDCVFENENFTDEIAVSLKMQEPKLEWTVESFRTKIQPGSPENWSFKLNGLHTKTEAEVLASMYDSSLDQFTVTEWELLNFNNYNYNRANFKTSIGFEQIYSNVNYLNDIHLPFDLKDEEIKLKWFGFNFHNSRYGDSLGITIADIKDKKVGSETIKGDPDAVLTVDEPVGVGAVSNVVVDSAAAKVDMVRFVKPALLAASSSPEYYFQTNKVKFVPGQKITSGLTSMVIKATTLYIIDGEISSEDNFKKIDPENLLDIDFLTPDKATAIYGNKASAGAIIISTKTALQDLTQVKARKNLSETAFFFPNLKTDSKGKVSFNFTSPEALTSWKLRLLAHNKEAASGYLEKSVVTQKELMVLPNFPRFFREKDTIVISAKISNVTAEAKTGIASLQFFDAVTMQPIDAKMLNTDNIKNFTIPPYGNTTVNWTISIPEGLQGVQYKILAKAGNFSDGEENILPVLTNNMLVTESIPVWVRENSTKEYTFENLKNNNSTTLRNHQFTLEYTSNPTWLAIQSLPYLMEYEHECAEQTFARFYANALASEIISSNPKIATVFEDWRKNGKLNSKLEENEELKSIILAETPWLNDASQSEEEKKKNLALLFDLEKMKTSHEATFEKLKKKQNSSGGFPWFEGGDESEYITRHILAGLGHLSKLSKDEKNALKINEIAKTGIPYLDQKFLEHHKTRTRNLKKGDKFLWFNPYSDLHYLYTRSFYLEKYPLSDTLKKATKLYLETAKKEWLNYSIYEKGLASLILNRFEEKESAKTIIESLKETASNNEDWGMYWIANKAGWYWYQAPIETQALLIEAFAEVNQDTKSIDAMKVWLLKNKQTKNWPTTKSTTEAIYALLMQGTDWLSVKDNTVIKLGDEKIVTKKLAENEKEAATGYIKMNWRAEEVKKEMASIKIENKSKVPGFGGVYWQYFEDLDKIKNNSGAVLSVAKELYLKKSTLKGDELVKITSKNPLKIGDLITVRLIISAKEDTEYIHLKDMRASCFEPVNVLSEYQYKDQLGYYMSTKDAATHFFFSRINKGTYVLEYDIRVNNSGEFSNGITTIQSMYAPEFASHTKGIRVKVN